MLNDVCSTKWRIEVREQAQPGAPTRFRSAHTRVWGSRSTLARWRVPFWPEQDDRPVAWPNVPQLFAGNPLGNWGLAFAEQRAFLRAHRGGMLAFGFAAMGLALVPVVNLALLPAAVAGMTAYCLRLREAPAA